MDYSNFVFLVGTALLILFSRVDADEERGLWKRCGSDNFTSLSMDIWKGSFEYTDYGINASCQWKMYVGKGYKVWIWADKFDIELCKGCKCDFAQASSSSVDFLKYSSKLCGTYTGDFANQMQTESSSNKLFWGFTSDGSYNNKGFKMQYRAFPSSSANCESKIQGGSGTIQTPKYPSKYEEGTVCDWTLKSEGDDSKVKLTFSSFELEKSDDCLEDFVEVRDGDSRKSPLIGRYCGSQGPSSSILSSGQNLWVRFQSNSNETTVYKGFKAEYEAGAASLLVNSFPLFVLALLVSILSV